MLVRDAAEGQIVLNDVPFMRCEKMEQRQGRRLETKRFEGWKVSSGSVRGGSWVAIQEHEVGSRMRW